MKRTSSLKSFRFVMVLMSACMFMFAASCAQVDEFETLRVHIATVLETLTPTISVTDVKTIVDDPTEAEKNTIISVRKAEHYAAGHVPGAINIPWTTIADATDQIESPENTIITYCYTGHTGQVACTILNMIGYTSKNMKYGMMGWTDDASVLNTTPFDCEPPNYETETTANELPADNELPVLETGFRDVLDIATAQAQAYLASGQAPTKSVTDVKTIVDDPAEAEKYTILSVRSAEHYATGHVPGAINIPWRSLAEVENLKMLPPDKPIITYCYTGHTGQVACTVLNLLGYEAYNMKYGMMGWTDDASVLNTTGFDCNPPNYEVEQ